MAGLLLNKTMMPASCILRCFSWGDYDSIVPMASIDHLGPEGDELRKRLTVIPGGEVSQHGREGISLHISKSNSSCSCRLALLPTQHFIVVTHPEAVSKALLHDLGA